MAIETVSGVKLSEKRTYFEISSMDVEKYLSTRLEAVKNAYEKNGIHLPTSITDCEVVTSVGRNFAIFVVIFDDSILYNPRERDLRIDRKRQENGKTVQGQFIEPQGKNRSYNTEGLSILELSERDDDVEGGAKLRSGFYTTLVPFLYSSDSVRDLFRRNVDRNLARTVKEHRTFGIERIGDKEVVIGILNPIEVFYGMVQDRNNKNEDYMVRIIDIKKISGSNYEFEIERKKKLKTKKGKDITSSILKKLRRK